MDGEEHIYVRVGESGVNQENVCHLRGGFKRIKQTNMDSQTHKRAHTVACTITHPHNSKCQFKLELPWISPRRRGRNHLCTLYLLLTGKETL